MTFLKPRENVLEFPVDAPAWDMAKMPKVKAAPGTFTAVFDPPRVKSAGGLYLPEKDGRRGFAQDHRPDAVTVLSGNDVPFVAGDRLMVAPYSTDRWESYGGVPDWCVVGAKDDWRDVCILIWNQIEGIWEPVANWVAVLVEPKAREVISGRVNYHNWGRVLLAGPECLVEAGQKVVLHKDRVDARPDDTRWFRTLWGAFPKQCVFVREVDSEGVRRVLGVIEDC